MGRSLADDTARPLVRLPLRQSLHGLIAHHALRPRDWPTATVERAGELASKLPDSAGSFAMAYLHFLDRGDWQRALLWLDKARHRAQPAGNLAYALAVDRAYLEAFHRRDGREAQRLFEQAPAREDSSGYLHALITLQAAHGDLAGASAAWNKAWDIVQQRPATGLADIDRDTSGWSAPG